MSLQELPAPLTPADCDLRDFAFMPLDVARLRDSDMASEQTPEQNWAAVLLWAAAWHQVPAASIPDSDNWIAKAAGYMSRGRIDPSWHDVKAGAMRGFVLCSDGRWYHSVVAEKANDSWVGKLKQRLKTECARIKKHNDRHGTKLPFPEFDAWFSAGCPTGQSLPVPKDITPLSLGTDGGVPLDMSDLDMGCPSGVPTENHSKGEGEGEGEGEREVVVGEADVPSLGTRLGEICILLRRAGINLGPDAFGKVEWQANPKVTDDMVREAVARAKKRNPNRITPAYLTPIIADLLVEAETAEATKLVAGKDYL